MRKYKLSESKVSNFFGLFGKPKTHRSEQINDLIDNDPILKKLDGDIAELNDEARLRLLKDKDAVAILKKYGIDITK
jgi:hypothetical protein